METYYNPEDLSKFSPAGVGSVRPELFEKFMGWYGDVFKDGALSERENDLIALAVASALQCPYCIDAYTNASLEHGADEEQLTEALHVAAAIRGGAALAHGVQMRNVIDKVDF